MKQAKGDVKAQRKFYRRVYDRFTYMKKAMKAEKKVHPPSPTKGGEKGTTPNVHEILKLLDEIKA